MAKKMTKKEMFAKIAQAMSADVEVVEFCNKEIAALDKKAEKAKERAAKKKAEGDELKSIVANVLTPNFKTAADIAEDIVASGYEFEGEAPSVAKVIYRLNALVKDGVAEKTDIQIETSEGKKSNRKAFRLIG